MDKLNNEKLKDINGGGISIGAALGIGALAVFIIGVIDGFVNPEKCKEGR